MLRGLRLVLGAGWEAPMLPPLLLGAVGPALSLPLIASPALLLAILMLAGAGGARAPSLLGGVVAGTLTPMTLLILTGES